MTEVKLRKVYGIVLSAGLILLCYAVFYSDKLSDEIYANFYYNYRTQGNTEFYDKFFHQILDTFKSKSSDKYSKRSFRSGKIPTVYLLRDKKKSKYFWKYQLQHIKSGQCPFPCRITEKRKEYKKSDAVLIYLKTVKNRSNLESRLSKRDATQPWIVLNFEGPFLANKKYKPDYHEFNGVFNRTMTYLKDADIIVTHGFIVSKDDANLLPLEWRIENKNNTISYQNHNSTASVSALISNCHDNSGRLAYVNELKSHVDVDVYGECGSLTCGHSLYVAHGYKAYEDECLNLLGTKYKFFLAFENSICKDYGTEKIYNILYYPIVPIVLGGINYEEILPPHSYINAADFTPIELAKYIEYLNDNDDEYDKYLIWRNYYIPSTVGGVRIICNLCAALHDPSFYDYNVVTDFYKWFVTDSQCRKWSSENNSFSFTFQ